MISQSKKKGKRILLRFVTIMHYKKQGRKWVILRGGRSYIYNMKVEILHGLSLLSPNVKCVAPLFRDMSSAKVSNAGGGVRPQRPPPSCAPGKKWSFFQSFKKVTLGLGIFCARFLSKINTERSNDLDYKNDLLINYYQFIDSL